MAAASAICRDIVSVASHGTAAMETTDVERTPYIDIVCVPNVCTDSVRRIHIRYVVSGKDAPNGYTVIDAGAGQTE